MNRPNFTPLLLALAIAWPAGPVEAGSSTIPTAGSGYGVLSYTFFNLSGTDCTLTPYGSGGNPAAYSSWAQSYGWSNNATSDNTSSAGFFNPNGLSSQTVQSSYLFFNNYDPLDTSGLKSTYPLSNGKGTLKGILETSGELGPVEGNESINYAAVGDSWTVACDTAPSTIAIANLASSASALLSNGPTTYPYTDSLGGWWYDYEIDPPADGGCTSPTNPCGVGFTAASSAGNQVLNWNVATDAPNYSATGGLWTGINYNNSSATYPAAGMINAPMLPINLAAYTVNAQGNFNPNNSTEYMHYTTMWGGHFTLAMGDPFVVSSYAAKMLWYLVLNSSLNDDTTLADLSSKLSNATTGVFKPSSYEDNYVQWLLGSQSSSQNYDGAPQIAANAFQSAWNAAQIPVTNEKIWGHIFAGLADVAVDVGVAALAFVPGGDVAVAAAVGAGTAADAAVTPDMNSAINNSFTTTVSASPPVSQNAPIVINPTYASNDLLGLFLTNAGVQESINTTMDFENNPAPLTSNYSINTDTQCTNIQVTNNLLIGTCNDSSGAAVANGSSASDPPTYTNVYAATQTTTQLSIWNAILTGSDVTTNPEGYMVLGNQIGSASFSPPVMMWNATNGASTPTAGLPAGLSVNTTFNLNTGYLTANGYAIVVDPVSGGSTAAPTAEPSITYQLTGQPPAGVTFSNLGGYQISYSAKTGVLTVAGYTANRSQYDFSNGTQTINMTGCPANSTVVMFVTPNSANTQDAWGASGSLSCGPYSVLEPAPTLDYSSCVSDPWATGGVIAAFTTAPNATTGEGGVVELACACVPSYLDGPSTSNASASRLLNGVVVGATSSGPKNQKCPKPSN